MYIAKTAKLLGADHRRDGINCQDAVALREDGRYCVGVVADGCGSGAYSETGALRAAQYLAARFLYAYQQRDSYFPHWTDSSIAGEVWHDYLRHLDLQLSSAFRGMGVKLEESKSWVEENLFHTIGAIVFDKHQRLATFFTKGDGYLIYGARLVELTTDNDKDGGVVYPAMALYTHDDRRAKSGFNIFPAIAIKGDKAGIATDGLRYVPEERISEWLFVGDDDLHSAQTNLQFAIEDKEFRNGDDIALVVIDRTED